MKVKIELYMENEDFNSIKDFEYMIEESIFPYIKSGEIINSSEVKNGM